jgi:hypothetical protein
MRRLIVIISCFLVFFAGAASAWASCKQISFRSDKHHSSAMPAHAHEHHADSDHNHSHGSVIHCPTLDEFLPAASFSTSIASRVERLLDTFAPRLGFQSNQHGFRLSHGPPGGAYLTFIPPYLLLSVLRI